MDLQSKIRQIPDFPREGIVYQDLTTLLKDQEAFNTTVNRLADPYRDKNIDLVAGLESRGFIFGATVAHELDAGFIPVRRTGRLPLETVSESFAVKYGPNTLNIHVDAIKEGQRVLVVDDILASGGTTRAACHLVEQLNGDLIGIACVVELESMEGRAHMEGYEVFTLVKVK